MKIEATHTGGMAFEVKARDHKIVLDTKAPVGKDSGPSPKELLLMSIAGCSGMDVAGFLRKHKIEPDSFVIKADATPRSEYPTIFPRIDVSFTFAGKGLEDKAKDLSEFARMSMTKYCGVSAMVNETSPIHYTVEINGKVVFEAAAKF